MEIHFPLEYSAQTLILHLPSGALKTCNENVISTGRDDKFRRSEIRMLRLLLVLLWDGPSF